MNFSIGKIRNYGLSRIITWALSFVFALSGLSLPQAFAYNDRILPYMPPPTQIITAGERFELPRLVGMRFNTINPFLFTFVINKGDIKLDKTIVEQEVGKINKYFLAALALPESDLWVNLSPYEQDRIITQELGLTELGKDMLGEDYVLKQLVASVTYPEAPAGKKYWASVYQKIQKKLGNTKIPVDMFNKVWIVPDKIKIVEAQGMAAIKETRLKVLMEEDYLAVSKNTAKEQSVQNKEVAAISAQTLREVIIPIIEEEVNTGKHFAHLRQIYNSIILASWFKKKLKETVLAQVYFNQRKIKGTESNDLKIKEKIYNEYVSAFKQGIYNYLREDRDPINRFKTIRRRYFSGGADLNVIQEIAAGVETSSPGRVEQTVRAVAGSGNIQEYVGCLGVNPSGDPAGRTTALFPSVAALTDRTVQSMRQAEQTGDGGAIVLEAGGMPQAASPFDGHSSSHLFDGTEYFVVKVQYGLREDKTPFIFELVFNNIGKVQDFQPAQYNVRAFLGKARSAKGWNEAALHQRLYFLAGLNPVQQQNNRASGVYGNPDDSEFNAISAAVVLPGEKAEPRLEGLYDTMIRRQMEFDKAQESKAVDKTVLETTGGLDFAATTEAEITIYGAGLSFSADEALAYLKTGKLIGMEFQTLALRY